jgi:hypothetical protein
VGSLTAPYSLNFKIAENGVALRSVAGKPCYL